MRVVFFGADGPIEAYTMPLISLPTLKGDPGERGLTGDRGATGTSAVVLTFTDPVAWAAYTPASHELAVLLYV